MRRLFNWPPPLTWAACIGFALFLPALAYNRNRFSERLK